MREGWKQVLIADLCIIKSGKGVPVGEIFEEYCPGAYPCYGGNGRRGFIRKYSHDGVFPIIGRVGALCGNVHLAEGKFYATEHALVCGINTDINAKFLCYLFLNMKLRQYAVGAAQPVLSAGFISSLLVSIPEIAKIKGGKRVPKGYKLEKGPTAHRYIRVADFTDQGTIRPESVLYISDDVYKTIKAYTISSKDVYISIAGTIGKSGIIPDTLDGANLTENACKLVLGPGFYNRFVFFATKTSSFKRQVETLTMQAAQPKLALTRLATIRVRVPSSIQEQETIVERLDGIADTIAILQDNYQKTLTLCDDLKQSLLRKAFNGEL